MGDNCANACFAFVIKSLVFNALRSHCLNNRKLGFRCSHMGHDICISVGSRQDTKEFVFLLLREDFYFFCVCGHGSNILFHHSTLPIEKCNLIPVKIEDIAEERAEKV